MSHFATEPIFAPGAVAPMSHCATLIELPDRDLLAAWFSGAFETAPDQFIATARRPANSSVWTAPVTVVDTPDQADGQPVFLLDHRGALWLYYVTLTGRDWTTARMMRCRSTDLGHSFDNPSLRPFDRLRTPPGSGQATGLRTPHWEEAEALPMEEGFMFRSRPLYLGAGHWLFPIYDEKTWRSLMLISEDDGVTWRAGEFIPSTSLPFDEAQDKRRGSGDALSLSKGQGSGHRSTPAGNIHPCVVPLSDDRLLAFMRTGGEGGYIWRTTSADGGHSWETPIPTPLPNPNSGLDLLRLKSGALVLAFNNSSRRRTPLCVALSDDEGLTWSHMQVLEDEEGEFSYPTLIQARNGRIHGVYTWRRQFIQYVEFDEAWLRQAPAWTGASE